MKIYFHYVQNQILGKTYPLEKYLLEILNKETYKVQINMLNCLMTTYKEINEYANKELDSLIKLEQEIIS